MIPNASKTSYFSVSSFGGIISGDSVLNALLLTIFLHQGNLYIKCPNTASFTKLDMLNDSMVSLMFLPQETIVAKVEKEMMLKYW